MKKIWWHNLSTEKMKEESKTISNLYINSKINRIEKMRKVDKKALWDNGFN